MQCTTTLQVTPDRPISLSTVADLSLRGIWLFSCNQMNNCLNILSNVFWEPVRNATLIMSELSMCTWVCFWIFTTVSFMYLSISPWNFAILCLLQQEKSLYLDFLLCRLINMYLFLNMSCTFPEWLLHKPHFTDFQCGEQKSSGRSLCRESRKDWAWNNCEWRAWGSVLSFLCPF